MALFVSAACFNFYPICVHWQSTLKAIIILMAWNQCFTIIEQVLSPATLNLWLKTKLHPAMHLVSCAMLTNEQLLTIRVLCLCNTVQDLMVSLLINGETLGNILLPGCLLHGKYCVYVELYPDIFCLYALVDLGSRRSHYPSQLVLRELRISQPRNGHTVLQQM